MIINARRASRANTRHTSSGHTGFQPSTLSCLSFLFLLTLRGLATLFPLSEPTFSKNIFV